MQVFTSPAILGQETVDPTTAVVVKVVSQNMPLIKIVPMPGQKGDAGEAGAVGPQGPQGEPGTPGTDLTEVTFGDGLNYDSITKTLTISNLDGGEL
jgi:hypothetical protein